MMKNGVCWGRWGGEWLTANFANYFMGKVLGAWFLVLFCEFCAFCGYNLDWPPMLR